jgi:hypothetical protein
MTWLAFLLACREDPDTTVQVVTGRFGEAGSGWTVQCSGWYPDWISQHPPADGQPNFQLAQGYSLGVPVFVEGAPELTVERWDPPSPARSTTAYPWLAHDFATQPEAYLEALKTYSFQGMPEVDFVAQKNTTRKWYHVPMMTTGTTNRREPHHGVTKERALRDSEHSWISGGDLQSYAIGYYNQIGSYTLGQVFKDKDPALSDPSKAEFISGALVFKLLFAEYDPAKIPTATDPLVGSPEWEVRDVVDGTMKRIRLVQVDIAVKDDRAAGTGWVFATYVYDKSRTDPSPWAKLTPVGLQWGNDPGVALGSPVAESWTNGALPGVFQGHLGYGGRLNGPVDNPASACLSCHATAQADTDARQGAGSLDTFRGVADRVPPAACTPAEKLAWFRNVPGGDAFGTQTACPVDTSPEPNLHGLDYSLQVAVALESALYYRNVNPCQSIDFDALRAEAAAAEEDAGGGAGAGAAAKAGQESFRFDGKAVAKKSQLTAFEESVSKLDPKQVGVEGVDTAPQR